MGQSRRIVTQSELKRATALGWMEQHISSRGCVSYNFQDSASEGQPHSPVKVFWIITTLLSRYSYPLPFVIVPEALWAGFVISLLYSVIFGTFSFLIQTLAKVSEKMEEKMMPVTLVLFLSTLHMKGSCGPIFLGYHIFTRYIKQSHFFRVTDDWTSSTGLGFQFKSCLLFFV